MAALLGAVAVILALTACGDRNMPPDAAKAAGKSVADLPPATADIFAGMDGGIELTPEEVEGRNTWMIWTGGNERFWNLMAQRGLGLVDLLKILDSRQRGSRFERFGLMNQPGFESSGEPDAHGLYLDRPAGGTDPEAGKIDPEIYGRSTGVLGLRLFPNPEFDAEAAAFWDAGRYFEDPAYAKDPQLVRPYRVGMTCAFCHVAPDPLNPPDAPENPAWANLSGTIGNQFLKNGSVFGIGLPEDDFFYHLLNSARPGTVDTSIMSTDYNNNPNIINGIFNQAERLRIAKDETVEGGALLLAPHDARRPVPHILVDGADTIGVSGALARVFINIGTYSEGWLKRHNPIVGGRKQTPLRIAEVLEQSVYWQATVEQMPKLAAYLIRAGRPVPLEEAPGGAEILAQDDPESVARGRRVFAENCVACHSSKQPDDGQNRPVAEFERWANDPGYLAWARAEVEKPDFWEGNYLSIDERIPVTLVQTNIARALQSNATTGHVWEDFSSVDYKETPSVGTVMVRDPFRDEEVAFEMPGGGIGFYRVPSLVAIWSSAPFFHQNALGLYNHDPSVPGRLAAFNDAIRKLAWPELRDGDATIARTSARSYLRIPAGYLPVLAEGVAGGEIPLVLDHPWVLPLAIALLGVAVLRFSRSRRRRLFKIFGTLVAVAIILAAVVAAPLNYLVAGRLGDVEVGPIPAGMPLDLVVNHNPEAADHLALAGAFGKFAAALRRIEAEGLDDAAAMELIAEGAGPALLRASTGPDLVHDRGHYFMADLSDADKEALIAFLKRL
jgi:hypothetical protein